MLNTAGFPRNEIAEKLHLSRETIRRVLRGEWRPEFTVEKAPKVFAVRKTQSSTPARCPTCGGKVHLPCRVCKMREQGVRVV